MENSRPWGNVWEVTWKTQGRGETFGKACPVLDTTGETSRRPYLKSDKPFLTSRWAYPKSKCHVWTFRQACRKSERRVWTLGRRCLKEEWSGESSAGEQWEGESDRKAVSLPPHSKTLPRQSKRQRRREASWSARGKRSTTPLSGVRRGLSGRDGKGRATEKRCRQECRATESPKCRQLRFCQQVGGHVR